LRLYLVHDRVADAARSEPLHRGLVRQQDSDGDFNLATPAGSPTWTTRARCCRRWAAGSRLVMQLGSDAGAMTALLLAPVDM
jgi:hypothetical protein